MVYSGDARNSLFESYYGHFKSFTELFSTMQLVRYDFIITCVISM